MSDIFSQLSSFSINELLLIVADRLNPNSSIESKSYKVDIKPIMERIDIYENIVSPVVYGSILVTDTMGLSRILSTGTCYLKMNISKVSKEETSNELSSYNKIFRVYKQSQRKKRTENSEIYTFYFCSDEYVLSEQKFVNKSFTNTYSGIAENIMQEYLNLQKNEIILSNSFGLKNITIPSLKPLDALQWCAARAVNNKFIPDFLSFENRDGYNFVSLSDLFKNPSIPINFNIKNASIEDDSEKYFSVNDATITSQFNLLNSIKKGSFAGTIYGYDIITRTFFKQQINSSYYDRIELLNDEKIIPTVANKAGIFSTEAVDSKRTVVVTDSQFRQSKYAVSKIPSAKLQEPEQAIAHRSAVLSFLSNKKMIINLPGNLNFTIGMLVDLKYPKRGLKLNNNINDDTFSGKSLVICVRHVFLPDKYQTILEICSDSDVIDV